jgi:hypothetical protein
LSLGDTSREPPVLSEFPVQLSFCEVRTLNTDSATPKQAQQQQRRQANYCKTTMMFSAPVSLLGAAAAVLSFSSISNMVEMYHAVGQHHRRSAPVEGLSPPILSKLQKWKSVDDSVTELQKMSRREIIQLYLECDSGDTSALFNTKKENIYDGYLLDNGPILVRCFLDNQLNNTYL